MASVDSADLLNLVSVATREELLQALGDCIDRGQGFSVATLNLDHIVKMRADDRFREAYRKQTHVVADGNPVVWLLRLAGRRDVRLVAGSELIDPIAALSVQKSVALALFGSRDEVLQAAAARLRADHPALKISICLSPPMGFDPDGAEADVFLDRVASSGTRICLIALGAPKQEVLAARGLSRHPGIGFLSIGAGIDFVAGHQKRAPVWVRSIAMEWFWRMINDPGRLGRRYMACAALLPSLVIKARNKVRPRDNAL